MEALWPQRRGDNEQVDPETTQPAQDVRTLTGVELDRRIRAGWDVWCELLEDLLSTAGMLPSRDLAGRVVSFFEEGYWRTEAARVEALSRQLTAQGHRHCRMTDPSRGIR